MGQIYKQTDDPSKGSFVSPAIPNLYVMYLETKKLDYAKLKPKLWVHYVDDIAYASQD